MKRKYVNFEEFNYVINSNDNNSILDSIIKSYVKYYIDDGILRGYYEGAVKSILDSSIDTLLEYVKDLNDAINVEYTNSAVGTVHKMKYCLKYDDIMITPIIPKNFTDTLGLNVEGVISKPTTIKMSPEIQSLSVAVDEETYWYNVLTKVENIIKYIYTFITEKEIDDPKAFSRIDKLFGTDILIQDGYVNLSKVYEYITSIIKEEVDNFNNDNQPTEVIEQIYDKCVGNVKCKKYFTNEVLEENEYEYSDDKGLYSILVDFVIHSYLINTFKGGKLTINDALKVMFIASDVLNAFTNDTSVVKDITNTNYYTTINEFSNIDVTANLFVGKVSPIFIKYYDIIEEKEIQKEYKLNYDTGFISEDEMFSHISNTFNSIIEDYDYTCDYNYDEVMLGRLGIPKVWKGTYITDLMVETLEIMRDYRNKSKYYN